MPTFDTPEPISVSIEVPAGGIRLSSADDRTTTVVDVQPSDPAAEADVRAAEQTRVDLAGLRLVVKAPRPTAWLGRSRAGSVDVTIELPAGSRVDGTAGAGDIDCDGRLGDCRLRSGLGRIRVDRAGAVNVKTGAGDIELELATGHAEVATASGDVRLRELAHTGVVKNANGDTWVGSAGGDLRVGTANGDIVIDHARASVDAKAANGDLRVGEVVSGSVALRTHSGNVDVGIREGTAAWLDAHATAGRVHNDLDAADAPGPSGLTVEVRARTTVGDVAIRRA
jgi:Putative adhesin